MAFLRTDHPPHAGAEIERWVLDRPTQMSELRASLRVAVDGHDSTASDDIVLVATELASNAFKHGAPPAIVRLSRSGSDLVLDVADHDPASEPDYAPQRPSGGGGLGLRLTHRLATEIGWYRTETTKHVWARFPLPAEEQA